MISPDFSPPHPSTSQDAHLEGPTVVVERVVVEVQFGEIWQHIQGAAVSVFDSPSDAGFWHSGLQRGLRLPDPYVGAVPKCLDGVSWKGRQGSRWNRFTTPMSRPFLFKRCFPCQKKNPSSPHSQKRNQCFPSLPQKVVPVANFYSCLTQSG